MTVVKVKRDHKNRICLPPVIHEALGDEVVISRSGNKLVRFWHEDKWQEFCSQLKERPEEPLVSSIEKLVVRDAQKVQVDRLGRVQIPSRFLTWLDVAGDEEISLKLKKGSIVDLWVSEV